MHSSSLKSAFGPSQLQSNADLILHKTTRKLCCWADLLDNIRRFCLEMELASWRVETVIKRTTRTEFFIDETILCLALLTRFDVSVFAASPPVWSSYQMNLLVGRSRELG